jgi:hypothetical protein
MHLSTRRVRNSLRFNYLTAALVVGHASRVSKSVNSALRENGSSKEVLGNVSVVVVEGFIGAFKSLLHEVEQLVIKEVGVHGLKLVVGGSKVGVIIHYVRVSKFVVLRALHFLFRVRSSEIREAVRNIDGAERTPLAVTQSHRFDDVEAPSTSSSLGSDIVSANLK